MREMSREVFQNQNRSIVLKFVLYHFVCFVTLFDSFDFLEGKKEWDEGVSSRAFSFENLYFVNEEVLRR